MTSQLASRSSIRITVTKLAGVLGLFILFWWVRNHGKQRHKLKLGYYTDHGAETAAEAKKVTQRKSPAHLTRGHVCGSNLEHSTLLIQKMK